VCDFMKSFRKYVWLLLLLLIGSGFAARSQAMVAPNTAVTSSPDQSDLTLYLPIIFNNYDSTLGISPFGVQVYSAGFLGALQASRSSWARVPIGWRSVEPILTKPPTYNWSGADNLIGNLLSTPGLNLIVTINDAPEWALVNPGAPDGPIKPEYLANFAAFLHAAVERYDGDGVSDAPGSPIVRHWELYNEPDWGSTSYKPRWGNYGAEYAQMLSVVYPAMKSANPATQVAMGGIAHDWFIENGGPFVRSFLDDVLAAGGGNYFDLMNFHYYPAFRAVYATQGPGLIEKTAYIRNKLAQHGIHNRPMIITEAGWHSNNDPGHPSSHAIQARYIVQLFTHAIAADTDFMIWWMLHDAGGGYPYDTGLVTRFGAEKPAMAVYQRAVDKLSTAHYVRRLPHNETNNNSMEVYQFNDRVYRRHLYVAWLNPVDGSNSAILRLPAAQARVTNSRTGSSYLLQDGSDGVGDGFVTIGVGADPLYIEVNH
jgi:hypothetical protein